MAQRTADREATPFSTDPAAELPVGVQLSWRLRALIATGRLAAGERLPSFRRLAEWAGVNVNTVRAVYAGLEDAGLVVSRQGQGTFVAEGIEAAPELEEIAAEALRRAREAGPRPARPGRSSPPPARAWPSDEGAAARTRAGSSRSRPRRARRSRCGTSCGARSPGSRSSWRPTRATCRTTCRPRRARAEAHVAGVEELEQTRDTLIAQLSEAQRAAELRARQVGEARARRQAMLDEGSAMGRTIGGALSAGR